MLICAGLHIMSSGPSAPTYLPVRARVPCRSLKVATRHACGIRSRGRAQQRARSRASRNSSTRARGSEVDFERSSEIEASTSTRAMRARMMRSARDDGHRCRNERPTARARARSVGRPSPRHHLISCCGAPRMASGARHRACARATSVPGSPSGAGTIARRRHGARSPCAPRYPFAILEPGKRVLDPFPRAAPARAPTMARP